MKFWPDDINSEEAVSPRDILRNAGDELASRTKILRVAVPETRLPDRIVLGFDVINELHSLKLRLFEVSHQISQTYPVVIDPPESNIPEFLQRRRYVPGLPAAANFKASFIGASFLEGIPGRYETNEWVCGAPSEFKEKLKKLFSEDHIKSRILSLQAPTVIHEAPDDRGEDPGDNPPKEVHEIGNE